MRGLITDLREVGLSQQHIDSDFARATNAAGTCRRAADLLEALTDQTGHTSEASTGPGIPTNSKKVHL